jgi:hypothetical protein
MACTAHISPTSSIFEEKSTLASKALAIDAGGRHRPLGEPHAALAQRFMP